MAYIKDNAENYQLFLRWIANRISNNKNVLILTLGGTGTGKSYGDSRIAQDCDSTFDINRTCFKPEEFMNITESGILKAKGAAILYDDAGITLNSRNWYDLTNKMINYYLQIARADNQILLFNTPDISFLDSAARKLFHLVLITNGIDYSKKVVKMKPLFLQINKTSGKVYTKYITVKKGTGYGARRQIKQIEVPLPSEDFIKSYENKKKIFVKSLKKNILEAITQQNLKKLTDRQMLIYNARRTGVDPDEIAKSLDIGVRTVYKHEEAIKKKGYSLENEAMGG
jgi:DNA-binding CsgD family transcriptional regulator